MIHALCYLLLALSLASILFEEHIHLSKAKATLFLGTLGWILLWIFPEGFGGPAAVKEAFEGYILDISSLWLFLLATMTFVAYLNSQGFIDALVHRWLPLRLSQRKLLLIVALFAFAFSSFADNMTATLVCMSLVMSLPLTPAHQIRFAVLTVFAINSGGVAMITGDVTTLMIFLAGKLSITSIMALSLPGLLGVLTLYLLMLPGMDRVLELSPPRNTPSRRDWLIAGIFAATLACTIAGSLLFALPPLLVFLWGMSVMFLAGWAMGMDTDDNLLDYIRAIEFETLLFFLGVLLLVGLARELGVLDIIPALYANLPPAAANYTMGLMSALIDNVPMTAALLKSGVGMDTSGWLGMTYAIGVGGSLLAIGSAAGIVAMSKLKGLTFMAWLRCSPLVLIAYSAGFALACQIGAVLQ